MTNSAIPTPEQPVLLDDVVTTLTSVEQTLHQLNALRTSLLATAHRIADEDPDIVDVKSREMAHRAVATEIGAALRVSDRTIEAQMGDAARLQQDFPLTAEAFGKGQISLAHMRVIIDAGGLIEDAEARAAFERIVLARALEESPNRLRPFAKQMSERFRSVSFAERHATARKKRRIWVREGEDGMSELGMSGPTAIIHGIFERMSQMGFAVKSENDRAAKESPAKQPDRDAADRGGRGPDDAADAGADTAADAGTDDAADLEPQTDTRTLNEIRADILADLLLTGTPTGHDTLDGLLGSIQGFVEVTIPFLTATERIETAPPAHLEGIGPIDPETARILARNAPGWDRVMTDPVSGAVLAVDRYRPSEEMRRHLRARDRRCRFPGCRITARKCDDDHSIDHALGGTTDVNNLTGKCRRHHVTKHHTPWKVHQLGGGLLEWTSPTGRTYIDRPPGVAGHVTFEDVEERVNVGHDTAGGGTAGHDTDDEVVPF